MINTRRLQEIHYSNRNKGSTKWIIEAAIRNPNIIIVAPTFHIANNIRRDYLHTFYKIWRLKRWYWKIMKRPSPMFMSAEYPDKLKGLDRPIIFDNSIFRDLLIFYTDMV